jgi:integrase
MQELSKNSQRTYATYINAFQQFLGDRQPTVKEGEAFLESLKEKGARRNTIGVAGRALRRTYNLQVPIPNIEMLEPDYLTIDEIKRLIKTAPSLLEKTIIILMFGTACRISEILNLTMDDLELDKGVATVTRKGGQRERIPLGDQGTEALRRWLQERQSKSQRVFMDYTYNNIYYRLKLTAAKAKLPQFHPHILRHSRIRHLLEAKIPIEAVSEVAGHRKLDTTIKIYGRLLAEERAKYLVDF